MKKKEPIDFISFNLPRFCPRCGVDQQIGICDTGKEVNESMFLQGQHFKCKVGKCSARFVSFTAASFRQNLTDEMRKPLVMNNRKKIPKYPNISGKKLKFTMDE